MVLFKYTFFAVVSTFLNLFAQFTSFSIYTGQYALFLAMSFGTFVGLVSKYILDKKYIFYHKPNSKSDDTKKFILYSMMGVLTTGIFWGTEIVFFYIFENDSAKYIGAIIGLAIGYFIKYHLDKEFVFTHKKGMLK